MIWTLAMDKNSLPKHWQIKTLGEVCEILDNLRKPINSAEREKRLNLSDKRYKYFGATGQVGFIDDYLCDFEAILLGEDGAPFLEATKNKAYIVSGKYWVNNHAHILKAKDITNNKFVCYFLNQLNYKPYVSGTTRLKLNQSSMKQIQIPLPSVAEQREIVNEIERRFEKLDKAIENFRQILKNLKLYRQSVLKFAFDGKFTNPNLTNWQTKPLGEVCEILGDGLHGTPKYSDNGEYFFINGSNLKDEFINLSNNTKKVKFEEFEKYKKDFTDRTVFVSINGTLGNTAFYNGENIILGKSVCYLNLKKEIDKKFIRFLLKTNHFLNYANTQATGSTIKNVSLATMRKFQIPLPPLSEQKQIVSEIEKRFAKADKIENLINKSLKNAEILKQSILKQAFSGNLKVKK